MTETRWEQGRAQERAAGLGGYGAHFAQLLAEGADVEGEARLADTLLPRGSRVLDAGSGMGRVGAALLARGHQVVGVDLDPELIEQSRTTFPELPVVQSRLDDLTPELLRSAGHPKSYDLVVCVGNVMVLLAPDTERTVLTRLGALTSDQGRLLVGFHLRDSPAPTAHAYPVADFARDAAATGWEVEHVFAGYDLRPFTPDSGYAVHVLRRAGG